MRDTVRKGTTKGEERGARSEERTAEDERHRSTEYGVQNTRHRAQDRAQKLGTQSTIEPDLLSPCA